MGYTAQQEQDTLKGFTGSMGDFQQRGYNGLLPRYQAEPPQAGKGKGN